MTPPDDLHYDPFDAVIRQDPHPIYRRLRAEAPAYFIEKYEVWALSRFDDIWHVSNDTEHLTNAKGAASAVARCMRRSQRVAGALVLRRTMSP